MSREFQLYAFNLLPHTHRKGERGGGRRTGPTGRMLNALAAKANANKVYAAASKLINCQRETHLSANCFWPKREREEAAAEATAKKCYKQRNTCNR